MCLWTHRVLLLPFDVIKWSPTHVILLIKEWSDSFVRAVRVDVFLPTVNSRLLKAAEFGSRNQAALELIKQQNQWQNYELYLNRHVYNNMFNFAFNSFKTSLSVAGSVH